MIASLSAPPLAHAGHWFVGLLYLLPVAILVTVLMMQARRDRRLEAEELAAEERQSAKPTDP